MTVKISEVAFGGFECVKLENENLEIWVTSMVGPRILGLAFRGGKNLFAELPGIKISFPEVGDYILRGGHRLWVAPEVPRVTYQPDDKPVMLRTIEDTLHILQPEDKSVGLQKSLSLTLDVERPEMRVKHTLTNTGRDSIELAPWAITQLRLGGVAILPQVTGNADPHGLLPNRQLVIWPYTEMKSSHVEWGDQFIYLKADFTEGFFKVGFPNPKGWLGYLIDGTLFVKKAHYFSGADYYDMGSSSECYCNYQFLELETLGPKVQLEPGQAVHHDETWMVFGDVELPDDEDKARQMFSSMGLA